MGSIFQNPTQPRYKQRPKQKFDEQRLQVRIANYLKNNYPNVIFLSDGSGINKTKAQAGLWKAMNSEKGRPDMIVMRRSADGRYSALCMELKPDGKPVYKKDGTLRRQMVKVRNKYGIVVEEYNHLEMQERRLKELCDEGYLARFVIGYDNATRLIDGYFGKPQTAELF